MNFISIELILSLNVYNTGHLKLFKIDEEDIDSEALNEFEKILPNKSIWDAVTSDRRLGRAFLDNIESYYFKKKSVEF